MTVRARELENRIALLEQEHLERSDRDPADQAVQLMRAGRPATPARGRALLDKWQENIRFHLLWHAYVHRPDSNHVCFGGSPKVACAAASVLAVPPDEEVPETVRAKYVRESTRPNPYMELVADGLKPEAVGTFVDKWIASVVIVEFMAANDELEFRQRVAEMDMERYHQLCAMLDAHEEAVRTGQKRTPLRLPDEAPGPFPCNCYATMVRSWGSGR